jgi:hypothetical protein
MTAFHRAALVLALLAAKSLVPASAVCQTLTPRDSVRTLIALLASADAAFDSSWTEGAFSGDKAPFVALRRLSEPAPDSVLMTLVDCFTDSSTTHIRYLGRALSRGGLCYLALHNLVYRETEPSEHWPGNYFGYPTLARLRAAQVAWRETVRRHWYVVP